MRPKGDKSIHRVLGLSQGVTAALKILSNRGRSEEEGGVTELEDVKKTRIWTLGISPPTGNPLLPFALSHPSQNRRRG